MFTLNTLPPSDKYKKNVYLDLNRHSGTHWVAYIQKRNLVCFNSFGDLKPPQEFATFFGVCEDLQ